MKRLAMSVLMSALSTGVFANTTPQNNFLTTDIALPCKQKKTSGVATANSQNRINNSNHIVSIIKSETKKFKEAYYEIAEMDDPTEAFDLPLEDMEALELLVRSYEGYSHASFERVREQVGDDKSSIALEGTQKVLEAFSEFRAAITDINHLARQCLSNNINDDCKLEPNQEFFVAMTNATESALAVN